MTTVIGIRDLRASLTTFLRRAQAGERITVTVAGHPVAQVSPMAGDATGVGLDDLVARGRVEAPRRRGDFVPDEPVTLYAGTRLDRALAEIRK
ncbi:MAG: hypothetical protein RLZZ305_70 [Actinomycetota bacterium]|jgi:prevent-host-death family protein